MATPRAGLEFLRPSSPPPLQACVNDDHYERGTELVPSAKREEILAAYRSQFAEETGEYAHLTYDLACQWYLNVHAEALAAGQHTDSESESGSDVSDHESMPELQSVPPSETASPSGPPSDPVDAAMPAVAPSQPIPGPPAFIPASQMMEGARGDAAGARPDEEMIFFTGDDSERRRRWAEAIALASATTSTDSTPPSSNHDLRIISLEGVRDVVLPLHFDSPLPPSSAPGGSSPSRPPRSSSPAAPSSSPSQAPSLNRRGRSRRRPTDEADGRGTSSRTIQTPSYAVPENFRSYAPPSQSPSYRAPNRSQTLDGAFEYETRRGDFTQDTAFTVSQDGRRGFTKAVNVGVKRRRMGPEDLDDVLNAWDPVAEGGAVDETTPEGSGAVGGKRKFYESSVRGVNFTSEGSSPKGVFFGWCSQGGWDVPPYIGTLVWDVPVEQWDPEYGMSQPAAGGENFVGYPTCVTAADQHLAGVLVIQNPYKKGFFSQSWVFLGVPGQHLARVQNTCKQGFFLWGCLKQFAHNLGCPTKFQH
ncbi:hypothetical protein C8R43DRAFT_957690 [Mycena crocata]|nr:hypothetical protein C8R43DRAFT_957690 [Mycena crocata]